MFGLSKVGKAVKNPRGAWNYLRNRHFKYYDRLLIRGRYAQLLFYVIEDLTGVNPYIRYLKAKHGRYINREVNGYEMMLDLEDEGLSTYLIKFGIREPHSTRVFAQELETMASASDEKITIFESGANIGYFALLEAHVLGEQAHILAVEPGPHNIELLEENVNLNGFSHIFDIKHCAIAAESGTAELALSARSNQHELLAETAGKAARTVEVEVYNPMEYLNSKGCGSKEIDVVRMDIQGKEYEVLKAMEPVIEHDSELLLFVETHGSNPSGHNEYIYRTLKDSGFDIISVAIDSEKLNWTYDDLIQSGNGVELIVKRSMSRDKTR